MDSSAPEIPRSCSLMVNSISTMMNSQITASITSSQASHLSLSRLDAVGNYPPLVQQEIIIAHVPMTPHSCPGSR